MASKNIAPDTDRARTGAQNLWDTLDFLNEHILLCKKDKKH